MSLLTQCLIAIVTIIIPVYFYYHYTYRYKVLKFLKEFPSPSRKPLVGVALDYKTPGEFLQKLHEYTRKYGSMIDLKVGPRHFLLCSDNKFLEFLLSHNSLLNKTKNLEFLKPWIGNGLISTNGGPKWRMHRKLLTPAFHFKILEQFVDVFEANGTILIDKLSKESGKKSVDIYTYITKCALDVICESAMGTKVDVQNNDSNSDAFAYFDSVKQMCRIMAVRTTSVLKRSDFLFSLCKDFAVQTKALKILHGYTWDVIKAKHEELKNKSKENDENETDELGRKKKKAFLDLILEAKIDNQSLTDQEIREEVDTFMFAGHDSTATSSTFILHCIANHKDVQDKIVEEQKQILGNDKNSKITYANLQEMKYLENVMKESLRLYTPVPFFGRMIDQEVVYNGMVVPKGVPVIIFVYGLHMNPEFYPNPEKFDPSRFEVTGNKHQFAYIPFSAGPRNCIGQKYAMLEMKSLISKIVRNYELSPADPKHEMDLSPEIVLKSLNGVRVGIKLRENY